MNADPDRDGFAFVHCDAIRDPHVSDGALVAFALCCKLAATTKTRLSEGGRSTGLPSFNTPRGGWAKAMRCSRAQAYRRIHELQAKRLLESQTTGNTLIHVIRKENWIHRRKDRPQFFHAVSGNAKGFYRVDLKAAFDLPASQARLLMILLTYADWKTGECFPAIQTLAEDCGVSARTVQRRLDALARAKRITCTARRNGPVSETNLYRVTGV